MDFAGQFSKGNQVEDRALLGLHVYLWEYTQKFAATLLSG